MLQFIWIIIISALIGVFAGIIVETNTNLFYIIATTVSSIAGAIFTEVMYNFLNPHFSAVALIPGVSGSIILAVSAFFLIRLRNRAISQRTNAK
ncbi:hypothetical protein [Lactobacillus sp. PSON]|uniref:hypothetical protein n=1 Tax=Lactobacillus sp. PSON TaxID=3455454 RepID=UPI004041F0AE